MASPSALYATATSLKPSRLQKAFAMGKKPILEATKTIARFITKPLSGGIYLLDIPVYPQGACKDEYRQLMKEMLDRGEAGGNTIAISTEDKKYSCVDFMPDKNHYLITNDPELTAEAILRMIELYPDVRYYFVLVSRRYDDAIGRYRRAMDAIEDRLPHKTTGEPIWEIFSFLEGAAQPMGGSRRRSKSRKTKKSRRSRSRHSKSCRS